MKTFGSILTMIGISALAVDGLTPSMGVLVTMIGLLIMFAWPEGKKQK
jgi:hypothetical protein